MKREPGIDVRAAGASLARVFVAAAVALAAFGSGPAAAAPGAGTRILLNAGVVDTASPEAGMRRMAALPAAGRALWLVQYPGPIRPDGYARLVATGVRVVTYIPENTYLVWGTGRQLAAVKKLPDIRWEGAYTAQDRIDPSTAMPTGAYSVQLVEDEDENPSTRALAGTLANRPSSEDRLPGYVNLRVFAGSEAVFPLASRPDVVSIQPWVEPRKRDERQNMIVSGNLSGTGPSGPGYLAWLAAKGFAQEQFTASGFGVDVTDSGVDDGTQAPNHFGLYVAGDVTGTSRVVYNRLEGTPGGGSTIAGCDGHGTINAHIVGGYVDRTGAPFQDAQGYRYGLGVAPFVRLGSSVIFDPGSYTFPDFEDLQSRAYRDAMRVSSNSWGANTNLYTTDSQRYDALVRDAQPAGAAVEAAGNQEMVIVFAAGNAGSNPGTVGSPGTAKNVLTVGASENVHAFGGSDGCGTTDTQANSAMDIVPFSSRGPCGDGRRKPDLMAPGTHVAGGVAQAAGQQAEPPAVATGQALACFDASGVCAGPGGSRFWPLGQQWYTASSGTSHSTPAVAGGAALLRQYFINQGRTPPSPAMTKAWLMGSARYMTGTGANDTLYSNNQGMGLMDLGVAFDGTPRLVEDQAQAGLFTASGQSRVFTGPVADPGRPFRVTLAWTDAPGSTAGAAWKNDLDLTVTVGGNTYRGNVFSGAASVTGGSADDRNNVESVFLPAGLGGTFTVTVTATNVNSDGVPGNGLPLDQDFALVVYNACPTPVVPPVGVAAVASAPNEVTVSFTENGSPAYRVYRAPAQGGPFTFLGTTSASPWVDAPVSGGLELIYVVRAVDCNESASSAEAAVTTTGSCLLPPAFAGLSGATNGEISTCTNLLSWSAATPSCGGAVAYDVHRATVSGFVPGAGTRIAQGLPGTTFVDDLGLVSDAAYHYVVRAVETQDVAVEDGNTVERSARVTGAGTPVAAWFDDLDGNRPADAPAWWIATTQSGTSGTLNLTSGCRWQSSGTSWRFGATSSSCGGTYPNGTQATLSLGGNGTTPGVAGFTLPPGARGSLKFRVWYDLEEGWDGARLAFSTTGASGPWTNVGDAIVEGAPYITEGGYDGTLVDLPTTRCWTGSSGGANGGLRAVTVDLDGVAGNTVWFAFRFFTDAFVRAEGFYVDDVRLEASTYASCATGTPPVATPLRFHPVTPCRVVDTREPAGAFGAPAIGASGTPDRTFPFASSPCGIPPAARAVSLNVTAVAPPAGGDLLVYPGGTTPGAASTVAFAPGRTRAAMTVVGVSADGTASVRVRNHAPGIVDLVLDVNGYFE
jgi:hypothetical protein